MRMKLSKLSDGCDEAYETTNNGKRQHEGKAPINWRISSHMADPPLSKDPKDNPFSFANFVSGQKPTSAKLIITDNETASVKPQSRAPSATASKLDQLLNTNDLFQDIPLPPKSKSSSNKPRDLFESVPPPPPPALE